jgi:predicted RNA-binding Zn-ribbon protein involved in translation (DUF1610 family)
MGGPTPTCPSCGAPVQFRSAAPYIVCPFCRSLLVRRDAVLDSIGRVAQVPEDISPFQLQTSGVFERRHFTLVGRIRKSWAQGSWSEWCASFDAPPFGWLAEAQGDLVMTFEQSLQSPLPLDLAPGASVAVGGQNYTVSDVKAVDITAADGDLGSAAITGMSMTSIDLRGPGLQFATIEIADTQPRLFVGRYVEFEECQFSNLRALEGW